MNPRLRRRLRRAAVGALIAVVLTILLANRWVINSTDAYLYQDLSLLPENAAGVVLGTSPYTRSGDPNPQFHGRIQGAARLYHAGKVRRLIVSGANPDSTYNEPLRMREALLALDVPGDAIVMDFAGDRTFESVLRASAVFGLERFTLVTQKYHGYRALFIARKSGLRAVAFAAPLSTGGQGFRHPPREILARLLAVLDLFLLRRDAREDAQPRRDRPTD